jgi:DNA-binding CsgD family transcriptional regulator
MDPFVIGAREQGLFRPGVIGIGESVVPFRELERTEFYSSFGRRHGYLGGLAAVIAAGRTSGAAIGIARHRDRLFGTAQLQLMRTLMPHLQRAWQLHLRLAEAERQQSSFAETLDRLAPAVIIVGTRGAVAFANEAARTMLAACDGLVVDRGALRGATPGDTAALNTLIAGALRTAQLDGLEGGGVLQLQRPSGRRALRVIVSPLPASEKLAVAEPRAMMFVTDPEDLCEPDATILRRAYGLTPAEVEIALLLMQDKSVKDMSEWLGVTTHTVRFHMKQLFAKTGTARQGSLVRLLSGIGQVRRIRSD